MKKLFGLAMMLLAVVSLGFGQVISTNGGAIQGSITDSSGAVVPNAKITIKNADTGFTRSLTTDAAGYYSVGPLTSGNYQVTVASEGFQTLTTKTVVRTGTATSGNFKLSIGSSSVTVEVDAGTVQVNTEQAGVSDVITKQQIDSLPVNGRNFLDLAQIEPGVILQSGESFDPTKAGYSAISISGVSGRTTRILLDGQDITDETVGTTIFNVSQGSIGDFQLNRSTQDVSGDVTSTGQVLVSTNSGTNAFHGQAFYYFQDHNALFARTAGGLDTPFQRNQFGGSIGGPIIKDKLFFFGNSERIKQESPVSITMAPVFSAIQAAHPSIPSPYRETYSTVRLDYNGPFHGHYFVRGNYNVNLSSSNFGAGYQIYNNRDNTPGLAGGADFATGHFTHSFRASYEKFHNLLVDGTTGNSSVYNGFPGLNFRLASAGLYSGPNVDAPQNTYQSDKQFRYDGSWTKGTHNIRYGYSMNRILGGGFASFFGLAPRATMTAATLLANCGNVAGAGPCASDPLNGYSLSRVTLGNGEGFFTENPGFKLPGGGTEDWRQGAYIADSWKITPSFTLTAGIRWSVDTNRANQDLPTPLCSDVDPSLPSPCSGNQPLLDQFQAGFGKKIHQPWTNFGPQIGFAFSPGDHKTVYRGAFGIFYENDVFNNTTNARAGLITKGLFNNFTSICGGTTTLTLPDGSVVTGDGGVSIATLCSQPLSQSGQHFINIQKTYQAATAAAGPASNPNYVGNTLTIANVYGAPYRTPYAEQWNAGIQREIVRGGVLSVDYVHNSTLKITQQIDVNHVGAARTLNKANATAAITATANSYATSSGATPCAGMSGSNAINCVISSGGTIVDFAHNGLDSGNTFLGSNPAAYAGKPGAAFPGINPLLGQGLFLLPAGRSGYDALQVVFRQQAAHPAPGIVSSNLQISYSLSRIVSTANPGINNGNTGVGDQFFSSPSYDYDHPTQYMGRNGLDHTHQISFGGSATLKYGPQVSLIGHFYSAAATDLNLDNGGISGDSTAGIFMSDVTGDGTIGDLVPGTNPGYFMHEYKGNNLNKLINQYNATHAGQMTPAGQALVNAGLFTPAQLSQLQAVQQPIAPVAEARGPENAFYRNLDVSFAYPIHLSRLREGMSLVPAIAFYNIGNFSNFKNYNNGTLANTTTASGGAAALSGLLNGPNTFADHDLNRSQRGSGTSNIGGPRTTEFQLKLNF
ncbi:TonB-dependent receptor [Edaphobacter albus]|uniref:TonB-dependent receptor n=1 Tax=Edaphobacter sp. 4G125 TaxID=2763071 RepID=UPI001647D692|nr:TonB-dependent receptor [Edaphobacter sp. 4G125]QNI37402.1 TonB-dependent receptor [Edaphobacter sp. 4G125]